MLRFIALALLAMMVFAVPNADAAPITSIGGTFGTTSSFSGSSVTFTDGSATNYTTTLGGPFNVGAPAGSAASDVTLNGLGTFTNLVNIPGTLVNMGNADFSTTLTIGGATFAITSPVSVISSEALSGNTPLVGSTVFTTAVVLTSDPLTSIPGADLTQFLSGGQLTFTGNALFVNAGSPGTFTNPGGGAITASFTITSNTALNVVPEPATLALWGVVGMAGAWYGRRRLLKPTDSAEA